MKTPALSLAAIALLVAAQAAAQPAGKPDNCKGAPVPASLQPPGAPTVLVRAQAEGSLTYVCRAAADGFRWTAKPFEADLTDAAGKPIGKRLAGPTWQASDGSKVVGETVATAPSPNPKDAPWLLLRAKSHAGIGRFARVTYVQRVNTEGGAAPAAALCDASHVGVAEPVKYFAVYMLFE